MGDPGESFPSPVAFITIAASYNPVDADFKADDAANANDVTVTFGDIMEVSLEPSFSVTSNTAFFVKAAYSEFTADAKGTGLDNSQAFDITGVQRSLSVAVRHSAVRSRFENLQANVGLYKSNSLVKRALVEISEDHLAYLGAGLNYDRIDTEWNGIDVAMIGTKYGLGGHFGGMDADLVTARGTPPSRRSSNGTGRFASNAFWMMEGSYTLLQNIEHDMDILFRVQGQWSNSLLTSTNQLKLGGPNSVRAYPVSEFLRDSGLFASMEWFWKAPGFSDADAFDNYKWGELLKVSFFADYGMGTLNQALTNPQQGVFQNIDIAGYGAAVHFEVPGQMLARLQASHPLSGVSPTDKRSTHWWFDVRYTF